MIDEQQQPEDDYGGAADIIRSMAPQQPVQQAPRMPSMVALSRMAGMGSLGHIGTHSGTEQFNNFVQQYMQNMQRTQAAPKAEKPIHPEAQFYAMAGNMAGAVTIQKTKGPSLFTLGEEYDLGDEILVVTPAGKMTAVDNATKQPIQIDVADYAIRSGIKTVPFTGGDNQAQLFRNTLTRTQGIMKSLDELDQAYASSFGYIGTLNPTENATKAQQLETKITLDALAILTGTQTLGGGTSNVDMDMIQRMVPKAASTLITNTKGNERKRLAELRELIKSNVMNAARANGIAMRSMPKKIAGQSAAPSGVRIQ